VQVNSFVEAPILFLKHRIGQRNFLIVSSVLVGLTSGLAAVCLKYAVHLLATVRSFAGTTEDYVLIAALPVLGIALSVVFTRFFLNGTLRKGSSPIGYNIIKKSSFIPKRETYGHVVTAALTVGFGGSLGLESPMVSTGSAIGSNYGRVYSLTYKERTVLLGCGAAAGIAAAFNSPIAGVLFVVEVLLTETLAATIIPLIVAAACGALLSKVILGEGVTLAFQLQQPFNAVNTPYYILLGVLCGLISVAYRKIFRSTEKWFDRVDNTWLKVLTGGVLLFVIISIFPPLFGEGYESVRALEIKDVERLVSGSVIGSIATTEGMILLFVGAMIFMKALAAAITLGSGGNGGSFAPSLVIGSYLGYLFSRLVNLSGLIHIPVSNFTIVGMAGILSGVFYAPLTAIFLIAEITGGYDLIIPLMIVSSLGILIASLFHPVSMEREKMSEMLKANIETRDTLLLSRLDLAELIETNFAVIRRDAKLKDLTRLIASTTRNVFPVIDEGMKLVGLIHLDRVRSIIFDSSQYETTLVAELMVTPTETVELSDNLHEVFLKFDRANQWNLPVIENGVYLGFVSKSTILTRYRKELIDVT
jgi:CIC family chloride channel protein